MHFFNDAYISICGIDPGTSNLGFSHGYLYTDTGLLEITKAYSLDGVALAKRKDFQTGNMLHGKFQNRVFAIYDELKYLFAECQPDICIIEDFFSNRNVKTFGQLMSSQQSIMTALRESCPNAYSRVIKPGVAKNAFGVKGNSGDKDEMIRALDKLDNVIFPENFILDLPDTADAIAQMYAFVTEYRTKYIK